MKNLHIVLILITITTIGLFLPIKSTRANILFTDCYHRDDGVLDLYPYFTMQGGGTCPPAAAYIDLIEVHEKTFPGANPTTCEEVPILEQ